VSAEDCEYCEREACDGDCYFCDVNVVDAPARKTAAEWREIGAAAALARAERAEAERDTWRHRFLDVADATLPESNGTGEDVVAEIRRLRGVERQLVDAVAALDQGHAECRADIGAVMRERDAAVREMRAAEANNIAACRERDRAQDELDGVTDTLRDRSEDVLALTAQLAAVVAEVRAYAAGLCFENVANVLNRIADRAEGKVEP